MHRKPSWTFLWLAALCRPFGLEAQAPAELTKILARLERLEEDNRALREQVRELRVEVQALRGGPEGAPPVPSPPAAAEPQAQIAEKLEIHERRITDQAQTKVEASQRFPLRISGMALFNAFINGRYNGASDNPTVASLDAGPITGGGSFRQSVIGLQYQGPDTLWGGKVRGSLQMDFFAGSNQVLNHTLRIRTAAIELDWATRSLLVGQEKPIFAPREPNSLAQVGISPLTGAGNLWRWQPQVRFEQRVGLGEGNRLRAQIGVLQTSEESGTATAEYLSTLARRRPALEGRFEFSRQIDDTRRLEIAPGFHFSTTQVAAGSAPSNLFSLDWFANPWQKLELSGAFFTGQNVAHLGAGAIRQGFIVHDEKVFPVHGRGGWGQATLLATDRLSFNVFGGQHDDRDSDLIYGGIGKNRAAAANVMYRLAPNVIVSLEALQLRTTHLRGGRRINNHYDLAVAYLF